MKKKPTIFVQTNTQSRVPALVSRYSYLKHNPDWNVEILYMDEHFKSFDKYDGRVFYRNVSQAVINDKERCLGEKKRDTLGECTWYKDSIQNFFPMRFLIPEYVNYEGICLLVESDIFCLKKLDNILDYLEKNKKLAAAMQTKGPGKDLPASSVMLFDASKLKEWSLNSISHLMFESKQDFNDLMYLRTMYQNNEITIMPKIYNDFNNVEDDTVLSHMINTITQPWKTGLEYNDDKIHNSTRKNTEEKGKKFFLPPENPKVETCFFELATEALLKGYLTLDDINNDINNGHIRTDFVQKIREIQYQKVLRDTGKLFGQPSLDFIYEPKWYSADKQDKIIADYFNNKKGGYFVELGGDTGTRKSNTFGLESHLNWNGLVIEARPLEYQMCCNRRKCVSVCEAISDKEKIIDFLIYSSRYGGQSGNIEFNNKKSPKICDRYECKLLAKSLEQVFDENNVPKEIDYLSADIEGAEYDAFKNFPFKKYKIKYITVENHNIKRPELRKKDKLHNLLIKNNYKFIRRLRVDDLYVLNE